MALDVKISFSWTDYCRLCLLDDGIMLPLFEEEGLSKQLPNKIAACLSITTYDGDPLPRRICHKCLFKLNQLYEFRSMALESLERLKVHLLPLQHIPAVRNYLEKSQTASKLGTPPEVLGYDVSSFAIPSTSSMLSHSPVSCENMPILRVKTEQELQDPKSTLFAQQSSSHSPPDSTSASSKKIRGRTMPHDVELHANEVGRKIQLNSLDSLVMNPLHSLTIQGSEVQLTHREKRALSSKTGTGDTKRNRNFYKPGPSSSKLKNRKKYSGSNSLQPVPFPTPWKCVICEAHFANKTALNRHIEVCLTCSTCLQEFSSVAEKAQHEADAHISVFIDAEKKHMTRRCSQCQARFVSNVMLTMHMRYDHLYPSRGFNNPMKLSSPENQDLIKSHSSSASNDEEEIPLSQLSSILVQSTNSDDSNVWNDKIQYGISSVGTIPSDPNHKKSKRKVGYPCPKCSRVFDKKAKFSVHVKYHDMNVHLCDICGGAFANAGRLRQHTRIMHGGVISKFNCKYCGESFLSKSALYTHKKTHERLAKPVIQLQSLEKKAKPENEISLSCLRCDEQFVDDDALMLHLYEHASEPLDCKKELKELKEASQRSKSKIEINYAIPVSNSPISSKSLQCEHCSLVCHSEESYKIHIAKHVNKAKSLFSCSGCDQVFRNIDALTEHTCPGKQKESWHACCLDCGQALIEGEDHECDNKCPQCNKVFRSARGQRLHSYYKHGKGAPSEIDEECEDQDLLPVVVSSIHDSVENESTYSNSVFINKFESNNDLEMGNRSMHSSQKISTDCSGNDLDVLPEKPISVGEQAENTSILDNLLRHPVPKLNHSLESNVSYNLVNNNPATMMNSLPWHNPQVNQEGCDQSEEIKSDV